MFLGRNTIGRLVSLAAVVCLLFALSSCAAEDGGVDKSAPYVTINGQRVDTMTFMQNDLGYSEEYPPIFSIYLQDHVALETSVGANVLIDLSQYGPTFLDIEDFLLDAEGNIRYEQLRMSTVTEVPYFRTYGAYPLTQHTASVISSLYETEVLRGICVRLTNRPENVYVFVLKVQTFG